MSSTSTLAPPRAIRLPESDFATDVVRPSQRSHEARAAGWIAVVLALALAAAPLTSGYFDLAAWGPLALGGIVLVVVAATVARPTLTRFGGTASVGIGLLLLLSAASMLWAGSREATWTAANRLGLYCVVFAIVLLAVRERRVGRVVVLILGSAALLSSAWLCGSWLLDTGQGAFAAGRLSAPIGYVNGTAGLLVMGLWPWIALAETARRPGVRAAALAAAALIATTLVLTQSRAVVPAIAISALFVLVCAPQRVRRAANLIIVGIAVAAALPWTLAVYSPSGVVPGHGVLRAAAAAMLVAALAAGGARYGLARVGSRVSGHTIRGFGVALAAMSVVALLAASALGGPWLARQYKAFTALRVNQNAPVRFVDAGGYRYDLWRVAVREFREHPLGGAGAGNYDGEYYRLRNNPEYVVQPHSLELQIAAELGVPGLLALLLFCGAITTAPLRRRAGTLACRDRMIKVAAAGMFVAWLTATSVDWLYDIPGLAAMALAAAALLVAPAAPRVAHRATGWRRSTALVVGLALVAMLAASVARQYVASRYTEAGAAEVTRSPRAAIGTLQRAAKLDPFSLPTLYAIARAYARLDDYPDSRTTLLVASRREPQNYVPPALLGDLAVRRGDHALAVTEYRRALELNPRDPELAQAELTAKAGSR